VKYAVTGADVAKTFSPAAEINTSTTYTLSIDVAANSTLLKYTGKNYYFRIGALASVSGVGTVRHNYSPLVVIQF
jgi:uncharacterized membrane protein